jgi:hypothetical protein
MLPLGLNKFYKETTGTPTINYKYAPIIPLEVQVTMILLRAPIEMGTPSYTPNQYLVPKMHHLSFPSQIPQSNCS